jgi:hypothetical protein
MAIDNNVAKRERLIKVVLAAILIPLGFLLMGFWKLSIGTGVFLVFAGFVAHLA